MTKFIILVLILLFPFLTSVIGQESTIKNILDANLFELDDGRKIKLAGIDAPQLNNPIPLFAETAKNAFAHYKEILLKRRVVVQSISKINSKNYELVYLWLRYPFEDLNLNQKYLEKGFGKFINNVDSINKAVLIEAEKYAMENHDGIWKYFKPNISDTLDGDLRGGDTIQLINIDSTIIQNIYGSRSLYAAIPLELIAGSGVSAVSILLGIYAGAGTAMLISPDDRWSAVGYGVLGGLMGYIIGFPTGVYLVAQHDNPNLSWLATVGTGIGLSLLTTGASLIIYKDDGTNSWVWLPVVLSPIIGSLLYVHAFPPTPPTKEEIIRQNFGYQKIDSFKDYYNATINFRMELMRIYF